MRIDAGSSFHQGATVATAPSSMSNSASKIASPAETAVASSGSVSRLDFTSMTRQQLFDWMNSQLRSGAMSFEESVPFLGMTLRVDAATGRPVDMASDPAPVDFMRRARDGIAGALSFGDLAGAARLQAALATMQQLQGNLSSVDIRA